MQMLFKSFIQNPTDTCYDGEDADEKILYVMRRSWITTLGWWLSSFLLTIAPNFLLPYAFKSIESVFILSPQLKFLLFVYWYVFVFGFFFQNLLNWFFNVYVITSKKIIDVDFHGLLYKNISETPLDNIQDVTSTVSGASKVIFNYGDVLIQTSAEKIQFEFSDVDNPAKVRDIISDLVTEVKENAGK